MWPPTVCNTPCNWQHNCFLFAAIFHFGSEADVEAAWFMVRRCADSFPRQTSAHVSVRHRWDTAWRLCIWISTWVCRQAWGWWWCKSGCMWSLPFTSFSFLLLRCPAHGLCTFQSPAGSCLVLLAKWSLHLPVQKPVCTICMYYMGRCGGKRVSGGGV